MLNSVTIECRCPFCGEINKVTVEEIDYMMWEIADISVLSAFPYLSPNEREMLISGICPSCWEKTFG